MDSQEIIEHFQLKEHPEGGYFKETYRSSITVKSENLEHQFNGNRNLCTSILFLLTSQKFSAFHKIKQDEIWHFYKGSTLKLHMISPEGDYSSKLIGTNFALGEIPQYTVPAYWYFAAEVIAPDSFCFMGCTVSPGFDFKDFTLPSYQKLSQEFPEHKSIIKKLTHH
ncbi:cupin domain-containing protein [Polaribacter sp.]|uniref:cupin domain-containing protein n=1 Tax=Polaribacter sp. TaxID=1920175 RepID=UPI00260125A8|nr:cupin domain-containing protein [Polaribacter sp.]